MPSVTPTNTRGISHDDLACMIYFGSSCEACQAAWLGWLMSGHEGSLIGAAEWRRLPVELLIAFCEMPNMGRLKNILEIQLEEIDG
jgi:hypothetical protein